MYKKIIIGLLITVCIIALIVSGIDIILWKIDTNKVDKNVASIQEKVIVKVVQDTPETEVIELAQGDERQRNLYGAGGRSILGLY